MFWQGIETAPKTPGSTVITWAPDCLPFITHWDVHGKRWFGLNYEPTHWCQLALPPDQQEPGSITLVPAPEVSLRDRFAMAALQGIVQGNIMAAVVMGMVESMTSTAVESALQSDEAKAAEAYRIAKAMLKERDQ